MRVGSRFRGNDEVPGIRGDGACAPSVALARLWIPAYAGMTVRGVGSRFRGNDEAPGDVGRQAAPVCGAITPNGFLPTQE